MLINKSNYKNFESREYLVEAVPCKNGLLTLSVTHGGRERFLHSKYDPVSEARRQVSQIAREINSKPVVLVFGLGMGYHIYEILRIAPLNGDVYVFEPCAAVLKHFLDSGGLSLLDDKRVKVYLLAPDIEAELPEVLTIENCEAFCFFAHPVCAALFRAQHDELVGNINKLSSELVTQKNSIRRFGVYWSANYLANCRYLFESAAVKGLFGSFQGKTAIIVSAGPSLSKNVSQLSRAKGKALIICCDAAYKALLMNGITPDIIVSVSGSPQAHYKLNDVLYNVPLVYKSQSSRHIVSGHEGMKFYASYNYAFLDNALIEAGIDAGFIDSGGSVACSALDLAVKTGSASIVLVGQDFALTDGKVYGEHVTSPFSAGSVDKFTIETVDIHGRPIKTLINLNTYRHWFESYIKSHKNVRFIDATEGGARISGTEIMGLMPALDAVLRERIDIDYIISKAFAENTLETARPVVSEKYITAYSDFQSAIALVNDIIRDYEKGTVTRKQVNHTLERLTSQTAAIKYSILTLIYDIRNINTIQVPDVGYFKKIADTLYSLSGSFKAILEVM